MSAVEHHYLDVQGLRYHVASQGTGPLVLLCHGWPELWYSYRHQLSALAEAGFRAVAPDLRGCGDTDSPHSVESFTMFHLVGDMVGLVTALGESSAVIVGHDWGASVAWCCAQMRPDMFRAVVGMSVPHLSRAPLDPLELLRRVGYQNHYVHYFQPPGLAEAELERDVRVSLRKILVGLAGDAPPSCPAIGLLQEGGGLLDGRDDPEQLPPWLSERDLSVFAAAYDRTGFRGGLSWYRNMSRNWELAAPWTGAKVAVPAMFIAGSREPIVAGPFGAPALADMEVTVPGVQRVILDGAGHWIQQERPSEVNRALITFLRGLEA